MDSIERIIQSSWRHQVLFTDRAFDPANPLLRATLRQDTEGENPKVLVVMDQALASAQPELPAAVNGYFFNHEPALKLVCPPLLTPGGERVKTEWQHVSELLVAIDRHHIDRHSYVIAIGGGALLDMAGLASATAHRGIRHVRLPTTTLSQCDSGVGVKNGINAFGKKNFIGTFCPPFAVINDFQLLSTLAPADKRAGYAEAVKVGCIRDRAFFEWLEREAPALRAFEPAPLRQAIRRCAELHVEHIAHGGDPFEIGNARPLDFGHWSAHKLELLSGFRLRHGEAVAIGIALDALYARRMGYLPAGEAERILSLLEALGFALFAPELRLKNSPTEWVLLEGFNEFREHLGGRLSIPQLRAIGASFEVHEMDLRVVLESIEELRDRAAPPR